ncbi:MAG: MFS transporter [Ruminococcaceae bacterium]|nr:MFS transporter [Oscillospiraceae bacterium]
MTVLLLFVIYLAFVGLGLPDSLLGSAWTVMRLEIGADTEVAGMVAFVVSAGTVVSSLCASRFIYRFGTAKVTLVSILLTVIAVTGYSLTTAPWFLFLCAIPLGLGAGAVDAALSNYVALHYEARHMNWLHCCWGIGATAGPLVMSFCIEHGNQWRWGFRSIAVALFLIVLAVLALLSFWQKNDRAKGADGEESKPVSNREAFSIRGVKSCMLAMLCYNGTEMATGVWMATFFVEVRGMTAADAAACCSVFYVGIIVSRLIAGAVSSRIDAKYLIRWGALIGCAGIALLLLPLPGMLPGIGLFLMGFGGGPVYPTIVHATPHRFGERASASVMGLEMASAYVGSVLLPFIVGFLAGWVGMILIPVIFLLMYFFVFLSAEFTNRAV